MGLAQARPNKAEKQSDRHADISAVSVAIETGLLEMKAESSGTSEYSYFYKSKRASIHPHERVKANGVS